MVALALAFLTPDLMFITGLVAAVALHYPAMSWVAKRFPMFSEAEGENEQYLLEQEDGELTTHQ